MKNTSELQSTENKVLERSADSVVKQFVRALKKLEQTGVVENMVALFSEEEAELSNVVLPWPLRGKAGAYRFWRDYLTSFQRVESQFVNVMEWEGSAVLEWVSRGWLPSGVPFKYEGITILTLSDNKIVRLKAYYDSAVFLKEGGKHVA